MMEIREIDITDGLNKAMFERLEEENKTLKEQLKEANRLIKVDAYGEGWEKAKRYIKKWGVK